MRDSTIKRVQSFSDLPEAAREPGSTYQVASEGGKMYFSDGNDWNSIQYAPKKVSSVRTIISSWTSATFGTTTTTDATTKRVADRATVKMSYNASFNQNYMQFTNLSFTHAKRYGLYVKNETGKAIGIDVILSPDASFTATVVERLSVPSKQGWQLVEWFSPGSQSASTLLNSDDTGKTVVSVRIRQAASGLGWAPGDFIHVAELCETKARATAIFTFDDGAVSHYTRAFPLLSEYGWKGTCYVVPQAQGQVHSKYGRLMTFAEMDAMYNAGWDISNHLSQLDFWLSKYNTPSAIATPSGTTGQDLTITFDKPHGFFNESRSYINDWIYIDTGTINQSSYRGWQKIKTVPNATTITTTTVVGATAPSGSGTLRTGHGIQGTRYLNEADSAKGLLDCDAILTERYPRSAKHLAWPEGGYDGRPLVRQAILTAGLKSCRGTYPSVTMQGATHTGTPFMLDDNYSVFNETISMFGPYDPVVLNMPSSQGTESGYDFETVIKRSINRAVECGGVVIFNGHDLNAVNEFDNLRRTCEYVRQLELDGKIDVMCMSEFMSNY